MVDGQDAFFGLEKEWDKLCAVLENHISVFADFMWYKNWWRFYGIGAKLHLFTMRQDNKLVGIAPLMWKKISLHGLPVRRIGFMENNQSLHNDFIVLPEYRDLFLQKLIQTLFEQSNQWDVLYFRNFSLKSKNYTSLAKILNQGGRTWKLRTTPIDSPYLIPAGSWQTYLAGRSAKTRKNLRNVQNKISKAGNVTIRRITTREEFLACKEKLFEVAQQSWTGGVGDSLGSLNNKDFFESLALNAAEKGWLVIWVLFLDNKMIAVEFHLKAYGKEHALRGHYLPEFAPLSPGTFLEMSILQRIFEGPERVQLYDFCGSFEGYKKKWTDTYVSHGDIYTYKDQLYSKLIRFHEAAVEPRIKLVVHYVNLLRKTKDKSSTA